MDIITNYSNYMNANGLAESTKETYLSEFKAWQAYFKGADMRYLSRDKIVEYLSRLYDLGFSASKVNQAINALKFYNEKVLGHKRQTFFVKRPHRKRFFPTILTPEKMREVIFNSANLKHQALLFFIYNNGLRKSESLNLTLMDLRTKCDNPHIIVREAKYNSSRIIYLSDECVELLRSYYRQYKPGHYLFNGQKRGSAYSETSLAKILSKACTACGVVHRFRVHDLRHNFATHCLMAGTDIYHLSKILGHKSVQTTEKYYAHLLPTQIKITRPQIQPDTKVIQLRRVV